MNAKYRDKIEELDKKREESLIKVKTSLKKINNKVRDLSDKVKSGEIKDRPGFSQFSMETPQSMIPTG